MAENVSESGRSPIWELFARQAAFIVLLLIFAFFSLSIYSYAPADPGWFYSGDGGAVQNSMGALGATLADVLSAFFGTVFFSFPVLILAGGVAIWRNTYQLRATTNALLGTVGGVLYLSFGSSLSFLHTIGHVELQYGAGGILGHGLGYWLFEWVGYDGATLLSLAFVILSVTLIVQLNWPKMMDVLGGWVLLSIERFRARIAERSEESTEENITHSELDEPAITRKRKKTVAAQKKEEEVENVSALVEDGQEGSVKVSRFSLFGKWLGKKEDVGEKQSLRIEPDLPMTEPDLGSLDDFSISDEVTFTDTLYIEDDLELAAGLDDRPATKQKSPSRNPEPLSEAANPLSSNEMLKELEVESQPASKSDDSQQNITKEHHHKPTVKTLSEAKQLAPLEASEARQTNGQYTLPDRSVLTQPKPKQGGYTEEELLSLSELLEQRLADFGVKAEVVEVNPGPVITRFEIQPAPGVKVSRITNLAKDLARSLSVLSVRVVEVIAGKSTIGIEIPNQIRDTVYFSEVVNCDMFDKATSPLTLSLGHDISGEPVVADLAKMPHLLVAGTTGSGKSVGVNAMILSMLLKSTPDEVRMIMVDPKMLELSIYEGIPHLLTPVITDMKDAANGLRWSVDEMERRYKLMSKLGVRNIAGYNKKVREAMEAGSPIEDPLWQPEMAMFSEDGVARTVPHLEPLPYIVIVVDEFADMMMIVGKKVEELIARIAQKARAAGIHLILATQRPSVDVITGLIKANIPTRMAFQVSSKIDSRTILDQGGADQLLGQGDMLYLPAGLPTPIRVHGAFVSDEEVHAVVEEWKLRGEPVYINDVVSNPEDLMGGEGTEDKDALYDEAVKIVIETRKASISSIQRRLKIGYNRAANLVEAMEAAGLVSEMGTNGQREVLIPE